MRKGISYPLFNFTIFVFLLFLILRNIQTIVKFFLPILSIFKPFFLGFLLAYAIYPIVLFFRKIFSKRISYILVLLGIVLVFLFFLFCLLPLLFKQVLGFSVQILQILPSFQKEVKEVVVHISSLLLKDMNFSYQLFSSFVDFFSSVFLFFVSFFYFFFSMEKVRNWIKEKVSFSSYLSYLDKNMIVYVKSLGVFILEQFIEYSVLFYFIGHPYFLILGFVMGLFVVFPYIGGILSTLLALLSAYYISLPLFYFTLFICLFFPIVDEYFISPKIYGKKNQISFLVTIFILSLGGNLFGVLGFTLAIPTYLFFRSTFLYFKDDLKSSFRKLKDVL